MRWAHVAWIVFIGGLILFDIAMVGCNNIPGDTLSEAVWQARFDPKSIFLGLGIGVVLGHLFWQRGRDDD